jgi:hypothetical protein
MAVDDLRKVGAGRANAARVTNSSEDDNCVTEVLPTRHTGFPRTPIESSACRLLCAGYPSKAFSEGSAVDYQFLLGKMLWLHNQRYVVSAVGMSNGVPIARVLARVDNESVMRTFPARFVAQHLVCDPVTAAS